MIIMPDPARLVSRSVGIMQANGITAEQAYLAIMDITQGLHDDECTPADSQPCWYLLIWLQAYRRWRDITRDGRPCADSPESASAPNAVSHQPQSPSR